MDKKIILSGIKPTGIPTLGNYIGALRNWNLMQQDDNYCYYMVADMHALTVRNDPATLRQETRSMAALLIACGIDPERSPLFIQSHVHQHAELSWLLGCTTYMGELSRMTQFKDKSAKHADNINAGLFDYPVLMASDILLYQTDIVPVGADQKQHVEICRDIAQRFNGIYGDVFTIPEPYIPKATAKIMSLAEPTKKMSKSDPEDTFIAVLDKPEDIRRKLKRAVTDSDGEIRYDPETKPGVSNLLTILSVLKKQSMEETVASLSGLGYGALKEAVSEAVIAELSPIQERYNAIIADKDGMAAMLKRNAERAAYLAQKTLRKVYKKVGLYQV